MECVVDARIVGKRIHRDDRDRSENQPEIPPQLGILPHKVKFSPQQEEIDREVHTEQRHEHRRDRLRIVAVTEERVALDRETAGARRAERVAERIKDRHTARQIEEDLDDGQREIDRVEDLRRVGHPRHHLRHGRAGAFRAEQMDALPALEPQDRHHEHQNAHAADPVRKAAPEQHAVAQRLDVRQDGRAGRREAGDHLKHRVEIRRDLARQRERHRADQRQHNPAQRHGHKAVARVDRLVFRPRDEHHQPAGCCCAENGVEEIETCPLAVEQRRHQREQHQPALDEEQRAEQPDDHAFIHGHILCARLGCRPARAGRASS